MLRQWDIHIKPWVYNDPPLDVNSLLHLHKPRCHYPNPRHNPPWEPLPVCLVFAPLQNRGYHLRDQCTCWGHPHEIYQHCDSIHWRTREHHHRIEDTPRPRHCGTNPPIPHLPRLQRTGATHLQGHGRTCSSRQQLALPLWLRRNAPLIVQYLKI